MRIFLPLLMQPAMLNETGFRRVFRRNPLKKQDFFLMH